MTRAGAGRSFAVALLLAAAPAAADTLRVASGEEVFFRLDAPAGARWCLEWNHSVTGGAVADCFVNDRGRMTLERSFLHDFAAGLGTIPGRGELRSAPGGYWIEDMDEIIPGNSLPLRVGRPSTDHRIRFDGEVFDLSDVAAGRRVTLTLVPE